MKNVKTILCLISLLVAGITNVWGWTCGNTTITVSGSSYIVSPIANTDGAMSDLASAPTTNWGTAAYKGSSSYTSIVFEEGVTHIGANTFNGFSYVTSVTIPASVASIGDKAFSGCTSIAEIHASTPNDWAMIDMDMSSGRYSHPFFARWYKNNANKGQFYFYGKNSAATELVFTSGITEIKNYAFSFSTGIENVYIPGTVTSIGNYALDCNITRLTINSITPPEVGTTAISFTTSTSNTYLYVPEGAKSGYKSNPFYNSSSATTGAHYIGYSGDQNRNGNIGGTGHTYIVEGDINSVHWDLAEDGTLTLNGTGSMPSTYGNAYNSDVVLPWFRFRYLVNNVVIKGGITDIGNALDKCWAIEEVSIEQNNIPTGTYGIYVNYKKSTDKVALKINPASLTDGTVTNLGSAPWNSDKLDIALSDTVTIDQASADNTTILTNCSTYVEKPVNVKLTRSTFSPLYYNTFCSPVSMTESEIKTLFGNTTHLVEFDDAVVERDTLRLNFKDATSIVAGQPYLIKPEKSISNPRFTGITPTALATSGATVTGDDASFYGILSPLDITDEWADGKNFIFLLADNKFTYATGGTLKGMRAYFLLDDDVEPGVLAHSPKMRINYEAEGGQTPTAIDKTQTEVKAEKVMENGVMYIIKNGVKYSVMGDRVR